MNCRIIYKDNKIDHVQAENGERSILFDSLKDIFGAEKALELYALTEEDGYKQKIQEKVRSFVGVTEKQIDKLSEVIDVQETLNKLVETGLADNVYQMTSEEIEAKLVELGVESDVARQVSQSGGYYSNANTAFTNLKDKNVKNVQGWVKALTDVQKNGGIKNVNQELEWIGLEDYLNQYVKENNPKAGNIPSSVVEDYIKSNQIEIVDITKTENGTGTDESVMNDTKYSGYQLKGAENYREILLTMPSKRTDITEAQKVLEEASLGNLSYDSQEVKDAQKTIDRYNSENKDEYSSSHWSEKNILAHVRLNEKTLPDGRRVLIVNEIQSDWQSQGRKGGFNTQEAEEKTNRLKINLNKAKQDLEDIEKELDLQYNSKKENNESRGDLRKRDEDFNTLASKYNPAVLKVDDLESELNRHLADNRNSVPKMPYANTDQYIGLVTRKVMQMASQEGYDGIAFATGQQSADMYSLSQQVDKININPQGDIKAVYISMKNNADDTVFINQEGIITESASGAYNGKQAEEVLGKDLTRKILETNEETTLEGEGLEFGGEGMKTFYDKIVPKVVQKEAQRFDKNAKLETVDFSEKVLSYNEIQEMLQDFEKYPSGSRERADLRQQQETAPDTDKLSLGVQPYLPLTQSIKDSVSQGIPQFQKSGITPITNGFIYKNDVYLNKNADESTMVHEFKHLYNKWLKQNRPEVYKKGIDLVKKEVEDKQKKLDLINKTNPAPNNYNTWVRSVEDIKTAEEVFETAFTDGEMYADFTIEDMKNALESGEVTIYSSNPIKDGVFVTPSKMNAEEYAGGKGNKIYSKKVKVTDVAWLDESEGQYAKTTSEIQDIIDFVKTNQPNLEGEKLNEEILTELVGRRGLELLIEQKDKAKSSGIIDYLKQVWQEIKNMLGLSSYTDEQILNMNLQDFANASAVDLLRGERLGTFSEESNDIRYQIIGEKGASKIKETLNLLDQAKQLENVGEDEKVIEQKTGWFKQNGDWKYFSKETLNSMFPTKAFINKAKIGQEYKLEEVLGSNKLFEYYPQLKDIKLKIYDGTKEQSVGLRNSEASYDRGLLLLNVFDNRGNGINPFDNAGQGKSKQSIINDRENFWTNKILPLVHEIQHIIQETENFPMGGNPFTIERVARKLSNSPEGIPFSKFLQNVENTLKENKNLSKEDLGVLNAQKKSLEFFMKSGSRSDLPQQYKMLFGEFEARTIEYIKQKYTGNNEKLYTEIQDELALIESIKQEELIPIRKTSSNLKIEVKEVNGRLVVEPLVNGTKAGALRMLPYEDGYRVDSVAVYDKYQNKRLGTRLYQEAIKFLLKSQTPLYSLKVRSENAKKIWDKFVEIGVAQKVGEDYIAPNKGGLDKNNEAKPSDVMQYANTTDERLSKEETAEAIDLAVSLGVESSQEAVAILKDAFLENDSFVFDKKKMKKAGYNDYEITKILTDVNLQNQIKNNLAKLENTDFSAPLMDVQTSPEIGIFGKQKVKPKVKTVNVKTVNEQGEVVDKVSDTKELLRKTYPNTLPNDMPQIASSLFKSSENVVNTHNDLFYNTLNDLKNAALDLGVDLKDIENRVFPLENFKSFVNSLMEYYANPSDTFAEVYDEFFENYGAEKATKPTMSTPYTEYELFDKFNLVRKGDEYVKVEDVEIEPSAERQAKITQLEVEDFAVDFDKLEKLVYHKEQLGAEMKTLQKPLIEEINLKEVKKNPYLKATSEGVKLVSEDPLTAQKAELYGYEPKVAEKQPKKIETDYSLVQDVLVTQLTSENKVKTPKGNFTKFMDDNNKSVFLLDGSKQKEVDLEGYLSKADNTPKIEAKKLYSKEEFENNFGCLN